MPSTQQRRLRGRDAVSAARQAGLLFALAGAVTLPGIFTLPTQTALLLNIGAADLVFAVVAWTLPWQRWPPNWPAILAVPALAIIAAATWAMGSYVSGTLPFLLLVFVWLGLNFPAWMIWALTPLGTIAYVAPLIIAQRPNVVIGSVVVMMPVVVGIALLVGRQVADLEQARDQLRRVADWRAALTATLAHDVRSPLTALGLALEALGDERMPAALRQQMAATASRQAGRIRRLATGLLDLERIDTSGALRLDIREVPLRDTVEHALTYLPDDQVDLDIDPDLTVVVDPERFEQIIFNLTNNALGHAGPPVRITAATDQDRVSIHVRDYGSGVPADLVPLLFTRFTSSDRSPQSVGLGLWIVRELCRAHGGDVHYEPAHPGARFVIDLPPHTHRVVPAAQA